MNKPEIITHIAREAGLTKKAAESALRAIVKAIGNELRVNGARVRIPDLGTFRVLETRDRAGVNPRTGKKMTIPAMRLPRFSPSKALKEAVKKNTD